MGVQEPRQFRSPFSQVLRDGFDRSSPVTFRYRLDGVKVAQYLTDNPSKPVLLSIGHLSSLGENTHFICANGANMVDGPLIAVCDSM